MANSGTHTRLGLAVNMLVFLFLPPLVNLPAAWLGLGFDNGEGGRVWLQPPGWVVVTAWLILFPLMGAARWLVLGSGRGDASRVGWFIVALAVTCAAYAYYTLGLERATGISSAVFGLFGNAMVIVFAVMVSRAAARFSSVAAKLVLLVAGWTAFASISVMQLVWLGPLRVS